MELYFKIGNRKLKKGCKEVSKVILKFQRYQLEIV